jgi:hypothetical protein
MSGQSDLILQDISINRNKEMKYLGIIFSDNGTFDAHIDKRSSATIKAAAMLKNFGLNENVMDPNLRINLYKTYVMQVLTYGLDKN